MPTHKDLKRLVRRRMQKTGESYTAARAHLVKTRAISAPTPRVDHAKLAGMSDATIEAKTGRAWGAWVRALDAAGAHTWPHRKIAEFVRAEFGVPDWWTQAVTVGYERIRGLREIGQRRGGGYEASKSRTFAAPIAVVYAAFAQPRRRARWLTGVRPVVRSTRLEKAVRMTWPDGTSVEVTFLAKGAARSSAHVQHGKLPDREAIARVKAFWAERFDQLEEVLPKKK